MDQAQTDKENAKQFRGIAELLELLAANSYSEWAAMKYVKPKKGEVGGHTSKKKFQEYRLYVYEMHKLNLYRAGLCKAAAKALETGDDMDFEAEKTDSSLKRVANIVAENFKLLKP